jgi:transmembrane sensor
MTAGRPDGGERREAEAIAWLVRLNSGEAGESDWRAHGDWLADEPENAAIYARVEALWTEIDSHSDALAHALDREDAAAVVPVRRAAPTRRNGWAWAAAAAMAIAFAAAGGSAFLASRPAVYRTEPGQTRTIALGDGTRIDMNGGSRLSVRYDRGARRVSLADAEAAFDVAKDPARPFLITAGDQRIRVVGTAFDVAHQNGGLVVTVQRGVVEVARLSRDGRALDVARVGAGYQLSRPRGVAEARIAAVDPAEALAWRQHRLVFHGEPLSQVVQALNRAFATPVEVQGPAASLTFTGVLVLDDEDAVIRRLQDFLAIDVDRSGDAIVIRSRS